MKLRSVELFSGCGGLAYGLSTAGFLHQEMIEWDADAVATVEHNRRRGIRHVRHWPLKQADVRAMDWSPLAGSIDLVAGGPPCQPFSIGGKHKGQDDGRDMWPEAIRAVREMQPSAFMFENVRGLARPVFADYLASIVTRLQATSTKAGQKQTSAKSRPTKNYDVLVVKANAADFGAAQKRHRVIVCGFKAEFCTELAPPRPTHSRDRLLFDQWVSGGYWKRHGIKQPNDALIPRVDRLRVQQLRDKEVAPATLPWRTVRDALVGLGEPTGRDNHVYQPGARAYPGHTGSPLDQPAKALKAGDHGVPGGENMLVQDTGAVRYFTVREAARLQGLPDTYLFPRSWSESMRQLGNAVPTELSASLGAWIVATLASAGKTQTAA